MLNKTDFLKLFDPNKFFDDLSPYVDNKNSLSTIEDKFSIYYNSSNADTKTAAKQDILSELDKLDWETKYNEDLKNAGIRSLGIDWLKTHNQVTGGSTIWDGSYIATPTGTNQSNNQIAINRSTDIATKLYENAPGDSANWTSSRELNLQNRLGNSWIGGDMDAIASDTGALAKQYATNLYNSDPTVTSKITDENFQNLQRKYQQSKETINSLKGYLSETEQEPATTQGLQTPAAPVVDNNIFRQNAAKYSNTGLLPANLGLSAYPYTTQEQRTQASSASGYNNQRPNMIQNAQQFGYNLYNQQFPQVMGNNTNRNSSGWVV